MVHAAQPSQSQLVQQLLWVCMSPVALLWVRMSPVAMTYTGCVKCKAEQLSQWL
jgi:hypothetical protein